jgi:hypothetical protein
MLLWNYPDYFRNSCMFVSAFAMADLKAAILGK